MFKVSESKDDTDVLNYTASSRHGAFERKKERDVALTEVKNHQGAIHRFCLELNAGAI